MDATTRRCLAVAVLLLLLLAHVNARPNARAHDEGRRESSTSTADAQHGSPGAARVGRIRNNPPRVLTETSALATTVTSGSRPDSYPFADTATFRRFFELLNTTLSEVTHSPMYLMQV